MAADGASGSIVSASIVSASTMHALRAVGAQQGTASLQCNDSMLSKNEASAEVATKTRNAPNVKQSQGSEELNYKSSGETVREDVIVIKNTSEAKALSEISADEVRRSKRQRTT